MKVVKFEPDKIQAQAIFDELKGKPFLAISLKDDNTLNYHRLHVSRVEMVYMLEAMKTDIFNGIL